MRMEFQRALIDGTDLNTAAESVRTANQRSYRATERRIQRDLLTARLIQAGLLRPKGSETRQMAEAFLSEFRRNFGKELADRDKILEALMNDPLDIDEPQQKESDETEGGSNDAGAGEEAEGQ